MIPRSNFCRGGRGGREFQVGPDFSHNVHHQIQHPNSCKPEYNSVNKKDNPYERLYNTLSFLRFGVEEGTGYIKITLKCFSQSVMKNLSHNAPEQTESLAKQYKRMYSIYSCLIGLSNSSVTFRTSREVSQDTTNCSQVLDLKTTEDKSVNVY